MPRLTRKESVLVHALAHGQGNACLGEGDRGSYTFSEKITILERPSSSCCLVSSPGFKRLWAFLITLEFKDFQGPFFAGLQVGVCSVEFQPK